MASLVSKQQSIASKMTMLMALSTGIALLLSCVAFVVNDVALLRTSKVAELRAVGQLLVSNSIASLISNQEDEARELLDSLGHRPGIRSALLFDAEGNLFSSYHRGTLPEPAPERPTQVGHSFSDGFLDLVLPVFNEGKLLGTLQLKAPLGDLNGQIHRYAFDAVGVILTSLLLAILISGRLQRFITRPILGLAATIQQIKGVGDYSIRVEKPSNDEIGVLYDEFNAMLTRIDYSDSALHRAHEELQLANNRLEERVRQRTAELSQAYEERSASENRLRAVVHSASDGIVTFSSDHLIQTVNPAAERMFDFGAEQLLGQAVWTLMPPEVGGDFVRQLEHACEERTGQLLGDRREVEGVRRDGTRFPMELTLCNTTLHEQAVFTGFVRDLTAIKRAQKQVADMNERLIDASRRAGMAEVANGVLHNVGNVLNSVNVAASLISEAANDSEVRDLTRVMEIVEQHRNDLPEFLTQDERGKRLPEYLIEAGRVLSDERQTLLERTKSLAKKVDYIKDIVSTQQSYAGMSGIEQVVTLEELLDDALQINIGMLDRGGILVEREIEPLPPLQLDKQKVLQVLINLIGNAQHALRDADSAGGWIRLRLCRDGDGWFQLEVSDNGVGIASKDLGRIFRHGFTTKRDGHGFGLHSAALAVKEMGGSLAGHSDGPGLGARFTVRLPLKVAETVA